MAPHYQELRQSSGHAARLQLPENGKCPTRDARDISQALYNRMADKNSTRESQTLLAAFWRNSCQERSDEILPPAGCEGEEGENASDFAATKADRQAGPRPEEPRSAFHISINASDEFDT